MLGLQLRTWIFDLLSLDGGSLMDRPYSDRRAELEALGLNSATWTTNSLTDDSELLRRLRDADVPGTKEVRAAP